MSWSLADIPDLRGRRALVTGVTSGLGERTAAELVKSGAAVLLAARDHERLAATVEQVGREAPAAHVKGLVCDLADLSSVRAAAKEAAAFGPIDILVNNAGIMATPHHRTTDGFELQVGTNHLGHFALTGLLLDQLVASGDARVVTVSSHLARGALGPPLGDPREPAKPYNRWYVYAQSKLSNLLFAFELDRRTTAAGLPVTSVAAHPGWTHTALQKEVAIVDAVSSLVGQSSARGALPILMAATLPGLAGSTYVGPSGPFEMRGSPKVVRPPRQARDERAARALWELSEQATGVRYLS